MIKNILVSALVAVVAVAAYAIFFTHPALFGASSGPDHYNQENFNAGLSIGGQGNTPVAVRNCVTATWNPASTAGTSVSSSDTSVDIPIPGAVMGDTCVGSLTSATTSAAQIECNITGTATATISEVNTSGGALDLATGTAKACYTH